MADGLARARIATLLGSVLTALSSGTNYVYSAYAPQLGTRLHITYTQLNIIGLSGNMGVYTTGPVIGRVVDKRGPRLLLILAFIFLLVGYSGLRRYYDAGPSNDEKLPVLSLIAMSLFSYMTGAGGNCGLLAASNSTAKSFPERLRATTVGLVLSGFGLSAFFFSTLAHRLFPGNTSSFLLFLALGTSLPVIVGYFTVRPVPHAERPEANPGIIDRAAVDSSSHLLRPGAETDGAGFGEFASSTAIAAAHKADDSLDDAFVPITTAAYPELVSAVDVPRSRSRSMELSPARAFDVGIRASSSRKGASQTNPVALPDEVDRHGKRMLTGWEFWLLFTILSLLSGTGLMFINNVGSISQALSAKGNPNYDRIEAGKLQAAQVSIISLANCGARIGIGAGADLVKNRFAGHRSYLLTLISTFFILSQIVASRIEDVTRLWQASVILGLGYGGVFGLLPTITIEWFGMAHWSENWGFVSLAPLVGGNLFSLLFGRNLDAHVPGSTANSTFATATLSAAGLHPRAPIPSPEPGHQCLEGRLCYADTLAVTTAACVVALVLSLVAAWRDRRKVRDKYDSLPQEVIWEEPEE
ncbi:MFS general substrate transporter [Ramaria rubella]|nr:MFS general substrate transporter [Ramaria rubella]